MGFICIWTRNRNPLIKFEQKQIKNKKPQISLVQKSWRKCMKNVNNLKKEGYLGLIYTWGQKPLKIWGGKRQKILDWIGQERKGRKKEKSLWKSDEHVLRKKLLFSFPSNFDRSSTDRIPIEPDRMFSLKTFKISIGLNLVLINRKTDSTERAPIEDQLN